MKLLTMDEVAEALNVSRARGYELVRRGMLPAVRIGRQIRIHPEQLERWVEAGGTASAPNAGSHDSGAP